MGGREEGREGETDVATGVQQGSSRHPRNTVSRKEGRREKASRQEFSIGDPR